MTTTSALGLITLGSFLKDCLKSAVTKATLGGVESASKRLIEILQENLHDGTLPANHDLQHALEHSLAQAANAFACAVGHQLEPQLPWLQTIQAHYRNGTLGDMPLAKMRDHPGRDWIAELIKEAKGGKDHPVSVGFLLDEGKVAELLLKDADAELKRRVHDAFAVWLERRIRRGTQPACVAGFIEHGWPLEPGSPKIVTFYQAFCAFFREKIKHNTEVERIFLAETVSKLARDVSGLKGMTAPTMDGFQSWLGDQLGELKGWLAEQFELLHKRHDAHDRKLDELKALIETLKPSLADLSQEELEREIAKRIPDLSAADLHRLIGYARFKSDISRILKYTPEKLIGREEELKLLNDAWAKTQDHDPKRPRVLTFVALGGEGKTSLVAKWAAELAAQDWPGCDAAFAWSFYSQGTREQVAASSDLFLKEALTFFGDDVDKQFAASPAGAFEKGQRLARIVGQRRGLLILDGLEPLQYAPTSPTPGQLKDQGIAALLKGLAAASHGLCVVTTRYSLPDLKAFWQTTAPEVKLLRLSRDAGVHLLKTLGVRGTAQEFETLVEDVRGHALTLTLLGGFLQRAFHGDIRQRDRVKFEKADEKMDGGHAFRTMAAYEQWLLRDGGDEGRREVAVLRLMGLFDRPADAGCLAALRSETVPGLTEPLAGLADDDWEYCLSGLEAAKLLTVNRDPSGALVSLDAHPHLREYFARRLRTQQPDAWRAAHRRLYEHLCTTTPDKPQPMLEDLQPLYQAVAHGCQAGLQQEACEKVYRDRIQRGEEAYGVKKLGAFGSDLSAVACFVEQPWSRVSPALSEAAQAWLLNQAAFRLRALGRLTEALEPMRAGIPIKVRRNDWENAARNASNLSELELTLGEVAGAVGDAEQSVIYADRSGDAFWKMGTRTTHADALHQAGRRADAETHFREAEQMQAESQPGYPLLYSFGGFKYCDLLLAPPSAPRGSAVAQASRLRVCGASRPAVLAAGRRPNSQPGRLRYLPPAAPSPNARRRRSRLPSATTGSSTSPSTTSRWAAPRSTRRFWNGARLCLKDQPQQV